MEAWGVWLVAIGVIVAGAAAVFAWVQAHAALESLKDAREARDDAKASAAESARLAGEANDAFKRQAEAQEEANRLKRMEMTPPTWTGPSWVSGELYRVVNTSGRVILVEGFYVDPEGTSKKIHIDGQQDGRYDNGDSFEYIVIRTMGGNAKKLTVRYTFEGEDEKHALIIPL